MSGDANEALFGNAEGAAGKSWSWGKVPGKVAKGPIVALDAVQQRDNAGKLVFWPSGDKLMIALVTIQTDERDPEVPEDDGRRTVWISGRNLTTAVRAAVKDAGAKKLELGGMFYAKFTGYGPAEKGQQEPRLFEAAYKKPEPGSNRANEALGNQGQTPAAVASPAADPWANTPEDPWAAPERAPRATPPATPSQAVSGAAAAGNRPSSIRLPTGQEVDTTGMPDEAVALLLKMNQAGAPA